MKTLVIGATNIDIIGVSKNELINKESNIGAVSIAIGGVAKNIVEDLKYLGEDVGFITYVGNDVFTQLLCEHLDELEIDYRKSLFADAKNNVYLAVHDSDKDLLYGLNDLENFSALAPKYLRNIHEYIDGFDVLVLDCNLSLESLNYLVETYGNKKIYVEGVSQTKVVKIRKLLKKIDLLKINNLELNALLNLDKCDIIKGVRDLLNRGVKAVVVSSGDQPITYGEADLIKQTDVIRTDRIKSTVGAGDALFAGIICYLNKGKSIAQAVDFGKLIAAKTLESENACNRDISALKDL